MCCSIQSLALFFYAQKALWFGKWWMFPLTLWKNIQSLEVINEHISVFICIWSLMIAWTRIGMVLHIKLIQNRLQTLSILPTKVNAFSPLLELLIFTAPLHKRFKCSKHRSPGMLWPITPWVFTNQRTEELHN